jgi:hypothetical protein
MNTFLLILIVITSLLVSASFIFCLVKSIEETPVVSNRYQAEKVQHIMSVAQVKEKKYTMRIIKDHIYVYINGSLSFSTLFTQDRIMTLKQNGVKFEEEQLDS